MSIQQKEYHFSIKQRSISYFHCYSESSSKQVCWKQFAGVCGERADYMYTVIHFQTVFTKYKWKQNGLF